MAEPAASGIQIGAAMSASVAGYIIDWIGFPPPVIALALAAAGLGMMHAQTMGRLQAICVWVCSALCAAALGSGAAELVAGMLQRGSAGALLTGMCVVVAGIAMHPLIRYVGMRFSAVADAGLRRAGIDVEGPK